MAILASHPHKDTTIINSLVKDYIYGTLPESILFDNNYDFNSIKNIIEAKKSQPYDRKSLTQVLKQQNNNYLQSNNIQYNIELIERDNTYCVCTAHQLNIFSGPLYLIIKILNTIQLCKSLKASFSDYNFVPIYVMGSEDHDIEEIRHFNMYQHTLSWQSAEKGVTGKLPTTQIQDCIMQLKTILSEDDKGIIDALLQAYKHNTLAEAHRAFIYYIFNYSDILILDGDDITLKKQFIEVIKSDILSHSTKTYVHRQNTLLQEHKYTIQAHTRDINLFYLFDNKRFRIEYLNNTYNIIDTDITFSEASIIKEIEEHPEHFSPNVNLRPLYQQIIIPAIVYIGGGGEISYWLQLPQLFKYYKITFPKLLLRNSMFYVTKAVEQKCEKIGLTVIDFLKDIDSIEKKLLSQHKDFSGTEKAVLAQLDTIYSDITDDIQEVDTTLEKFIAAEKHKNKQQIAYIFSKATKSLKQKQSTQLQQIQHIKNYFFPNQQPHERHQSFLWLWHLLGKDAALQLLEEHLKVMSKEVVFIQ